LKIFISEDSIAMQLRCSCYKFSTKYAGEKFSKIGQYLATIWTTKGCGLLFGPSYRLTGGCYRITRSRVPDSECSL